MPITIADLPEAAAAASLRLRDELLAILGADLVSAWLHGGTTFADRPVRPGDLDICAVIANVAPDERTPRAWRADPGSRPSRIYAAQESIARESGVVFDTMYLLADEVGRGRLPSSAFEKKRRETGWAVYRAHWLAGQYVLLHGRPTRGAHHCADDRGSSTAPWTASSSTSSGTSTRATPPIPTRRPTRSSTAAASFERWKPAARSSRSAQQGSGDSRTCPSAGTARSTRLVARMTARRPPRTTRSCGTPWPPFVDMVRQRLPTTNPRRTGPPRWS